MKPAVNNGGRRQWIVPGIVLVALLAVPFYVGSYLTQVVLFGLVTAYLCGAWNISGGYGGLVSFGHAAFIGIGAYATAIPLVYYGLPGWLGMLLGGGISAAFGFVLTWTICRFHVKGFYFAVSTILFAEILMSIAARSRYLGRGMGVPLPSVANGFNLQFLGIIPYYYMALVLACCMVVITRQIERSRLGWYLRATRQSEDASAALGIDVTMVKVVAMTLSAFLTGVGGGVYVLALRYCSPYDVFGLMFSTTLMLGTLLGGRGTVYGPIIGIAMLTAVKEILTFTGEALGGISSFALVLVGWGVILCVVAKYLPNGIGPWIGNRVARSNAR
ncbi:MAG TPA: branched-chain amino acid ABC transporter permease [Candidatus Methylomirabilis sp.]|nr:branched-chain amino acid ABC transporter permease [Candidatus Methylomirabilis sp.]